MTTKDFDILCRNMGRDLMEELGRVEGKKPDVRNKFGARKKELDGILFDSTAEANAYVTLKARQSAGEITDLVLQPKFLLQEGFRDGSGKWHRRIEYYGDFRFMEILPDHMPDKTVVVEVKGMETPVWRLKEKLFRAKYPHIKLEVWKKGRPA